MNRTRGIWIHGDANDNPERAQVMLKELCLPWHQLSLLECDSPLSALLSVLPQAQSLEQCKLTIYSVGSAHVKTQVRNQYMFKRYEGRHIMRGWLSLYSNTNLWHHEGTHMKTHFGIAQNWYLHARPSDQEV